jgi:hypothetical protein
MKTSFDRRDLLKTIGAAAAFGSTSCMHKPVGPGLPFAAVIPRVNLICHGMMILWQDRTRPKAGISIYMPDTMGTHVVRLSVAAVGGLPNLLVDGMGNDLPGNYSLQFMSSAPSKHSKVMASDDVVFDDMGLAVVSGKAPYRIDVPYPTKVRRNRVMKFPKNKPAFQATSTQRDFKIDPRQMAGVHVLTYDNVTTTAVTLVKPDGSMVDLAKQNGFTFLNLHLYATTEDVPTSDHLHFFDDMLQYTGHSKLDLAVANMHPDVIPKEKEPVDDDYSRLDVYDLYEIKDPGQSVVDPAGCFQSWGS